MRMGMVPVPDCRGEQSERTRRLFAAGGQHGLAHCDQSRPSGQDSTRSGQPEQHHVHLHPPSRLFLPRLLRLPPLANKAKRAQQAIRSSVVRTCARPEGACCACCRCRWPSWRFRLRTRSLTSRLSGLSFRAASKARSACRIRQNKSGQPFIWDRAGLSCEGTVGCRQKGQHWRWLNQMQWCMKAASALLLTPAPLPPLQSRTAARCAPAPAAPAAPAHTRACSGPCPSRAAGAPPPLHPLVLPPIPPA